VTQRTSADKPKKIITVGGGNNSGGGHSKGNGGGNGGGNGDGSNPPFPSPWLDPDNEPNPAATASFVEYLRWMREPDSDYKDPTKVQILQMAEEQANYSTRLAQLTKRTELIAGKENTFQVKCSWRIRVGGHRGPESILLPAFDALGMPYIPSSTLRGVARCQAIREIMAQQDVNWKEAEKRVAPYFGSLDAENERDRSGKVVFLDAYPLPSQSGGLAVDMANNIWSWEDDSLKYSPNPNPFLSLKEPTFLIGLRLASGCSNPDVLNRVKQWLIDGLQSGVGSQVNTGYGELIRVGEISQKSEFFRVKFSLEGQLIHGHQKFRNVNQPYQKDRDGNFRRDKQGKLRADTAPETEVRPVAFKSMLRYWFRAFALGVLETQRVQALEATLFGAINPQRARGWVKFKTIGVSPQKTQVSRDSLNKQKGELLLSYSSELPDNQEAIIAQLMKNLTWLMFHLGGVGQGARRPCYSRQNRPFQRGATLIPDEENDFWSLPDKLEQFQQQFCQRLQEFYSALADFQAFYAQQEKLTFIPINANLPRAINPVTPYTWFEAVDRNCKIVVVTGEDSETKVYALDILHEYFHQLENESYTKAKNLCGGVNKDEYKDKDQKIKRNVIPSPIWIADLGNYQVVTVFGATQNPRKTYLDELRSHPSRKNYVQIWPISP
jgi:CRISPR-associated protein Cmr6